MDEYTPNDFVEMKFNVNDIEFNIPILKAFPVLQNYSEFKIELEADLDINKVLRWVFLCYDRKSPFLREVSINQRKLKAAIFAGFKTNSDGRFDEDVEAMLKGRNHEVNAMVIRFAWLFNNHLYLLLVAKTEFLYQFAIRMTTDITMKPKDANEADEVVNTITEISDKLLMMDNNTNLKEDLFQYIEDERLELTPEAIARRKEQGKPLVKLSNKPVSLKT